MKSIKALQQYNASLPNNVTADMAFRVTMYPAIGAFPNAWEFTLIIVVSLLAVSFIVSGKDCLLFNEPRRKLR